MALIVYSSIKGGCGKTTLAAHHAAWLHDQGRRVALIDADSLKLSSQWIQKVEEGIETRQATEHGKSPSWFVNYEDPTTLSSPTCRGPPVWKRFHC